MKYAIITFYNETRPEFLLETSRTWGEDVPKYLISQKSETAHAPIPNAEVIPCDFPRGQTLNGKDCVAGVMQTMGKIARRSGLEDVDYLLKVDDDMVQVGDGFRRLLETGLFQSVGQRIDRVFHGPEGEEVAKCSFHMGGAYAISTALLRRFPEDLDDIHDLLDRVNAVSGGMLSMAREKGYAWPEDETMSAVVAYHTRPEERCWFPEGLPTGMVREWDFGRYRDFKGPEWRRCLPYDFVHMRGLHHFMAASQEEAERLQRDPGAREGFLKAARETCLRVTREMVKEVTLRVITEDEAFMAMRLARVTGREGSRRDAETQRVGKWEEARTEAQRHREEGEGERLTQRRGDAEEEKARVTQG